MRLMKWRPLFDPFEDEVEKFFSAFPSPFQAGTYVPAIDLYQTKDDVIAETPLAGIDPKDVAISIENDVLVIEGKSKKESEVDEKNYYLKEIRSGSFHRSVSLPASVDGDKAKAEFENGLLKITIPKAERAKPKTIAIDVKTKK